MRKIKILLLVLLCAFQVFAQNTVTGKVTDRSGNPVPGATITVKNTQVSTVSDQNGNYSISAS
ncbi:MAG TPA: carboxypeptidase regulatory-like domain-containing protein, partial [Pedobacter sp.]